MAVQFILGRSGTGKTTRCISAIVEALQESSDRPLIFLVPEQASYQAEHAILADERIAGYHRLAVLSFARLQFLLLGPNRTRPSVSPIGRQMIVHKILRETRDQLQLFGSSALLPGFARQMARTITELHRYANTPEDIERLLAPLRDNGAGPLPGLKFADISLIFRRYSEWLQDRYVDPEAQVNTACARVAQADFVKGARLWVDGFATFTGGEKRLLGELLKTVDQASVALCVDPARLRSDPRRGNVSGSDGLFEPIEGTYRELVDLVEASKLKLLKPEILTETVRFQRCPPLAHLERTLFRMGAQPAAAGEAVCLAAAPNLRAEVQFVARQVIRLVQKKGYRYRDIAIVASDLDRYEHYVRAAFHDYGIPFFIDKRTPLNQHPVVELISAALQAVIGGFAHADVFAYLKTDLVPILRSDVDRLENYCLAFGVDGRDWVNPGPWRFKAGDDRDFDETAINRTRDAAVGALGDLREALCPNGDMRATVTAGDFTRAVFAFLDVLEIRQTVGQWIDEAHQAGHLAAADEHQQFFSKLVDIFDELIAVFDQDRMTAQDCSAILNMAFAQMTLAFIPPSLDQVLVGSIERSRHPNLKAVFLLGATQKEFPVPMPGSGVLTDEDRQVAESVGLPLAPASTQSLTERQYLAYIAFTRPSEFLCVSYPSVDEKGSTVVRSHFVDEMQAVFEALEERAVSADALEIDAVHDRSALAEMLCRRLGRDALSPDDRGNDRFEALLAAMRGDDAYAAVARSVDAALLYDNRASLDAGVVGQLFGREVKGSATRLGMFAACPYKYFARYVLRLQRRREFKLKPLDLGTFYHEVLDRLHKCLTAEGLNFATVEADRLTECLREQIAALEGEDAFMSKFKRRSTHNAFVVDNAGEMLAECVGEIAQMTRAGTFAPVLSEVAFGQTRPAEQSLGPFTLPLGAGRVLTINGKIDRLDTVQIDGRKMALVLDYKRTDAGAKFSWWKFYSGLDIQLPLYLLAVHETPNPWAEEIVGAFCMPIEQPPAKTTLGQRTSAGSKFARKARGLFNGEYFQHLDPNAGARWSRFYNFGVTAKAAQYGYYATSGALRPEDFERVLQFARDKVTALAADIVSGRIDIAPYHHGNERACARCEYEPVCHFDWQINDYHTIPSTGKPDVLGRLEGQ